MQNSLFYNRIRNKDAKKFIEKIPSNIKLKCNIRIIEKGKIVVLKGNDIENIYVSCQGKMQVRNEFENGFVYSFDVQEEAIKSTKKRLEKENLLNRVNLVLDGHENIDIYVKDEVSCVLFNLGYLPRAKHQIITKPDTTLQAIKKSLNLLKPHGVISIAIYTGHEGGMDECNAVFDYVSKLDQSNFNVLNCNFVNQVNNPPRLILIEKKKEY